MRKMLFALLALVVCVGQSCAPVYQSSEIPQSVYQACSYKSQAEVMRDVNNARVDRQGGNTKEQTLDDFYTACSVSEYTAVGSIFDKSVSETRELSQACVTCANAVVNFVYSE